MKKPATFLLLLFFIVRINGQESGKSRLYLTTEMDFGNYFGINLNLNYIFENDLLMQLGYSSHAREAKSQPADYTSGLTGILTLGIAELHFDIMENWQFMIGKITSLNESGTIRLNMSGGLGVTIISEPTNWERITSFTLGENYTYDQEKHLTVSLIVNPKIEFPLTQYFGLSLSPMLQANMDRVYVGVGVGLMLGKLK